MSELIAVDFINGKGVTARQTFSGEVERTSRAHMLSGELSSRQLRNRATEAIVEQNSAHRYGSEDEIIDLTLRLGEMMNLLSPENQVIAREDARMIIKNTSPTAS